MNKYFAFIDGEQRGPFEPTQLIEAGVRPSTYVWCKEMDDWHRADEVEEIRNIFRRHITLHQSPNTPTSKHPNTPTPPHPHSPTSQSPNTPTPDQPPRFPFPQSVEPEPDYDSPPSVSMTLAVMSLIFCFIPTGIVAVVFTYKAQKTWEESIGSHPSKPVEELRRQAHEYARLAKMWLGFSVAFGIIAWTLLFSIPK